MDSTPVPVRDARWDDGPGTGAYAASKGPQCSPSGAGHEGDDVSPARAQDSRPLQIHASCGATDGWRTADASRARLRACDTDDVRVVIRLQDHGTPTVDDIARGQVTKVVPRHRRDARPGTSPSSARAGRLTPTGLLAGARTPCRAAWSAFRRLEGMASARTNLPPGVARGRVPTALAGAGGGLRIKLDQSVNRLDASDTERPCARQTGCMPHGWPRPSRPSWRRRHRHTCPPQSAPHGRRAAAPAPALPLAVSCQSIAQAVALPEAEAKRRWAKIAALLTPSGQDRTGAVGRRCSISCEGWKRQPRAALNTALTVWRWRPK